MSDEKVCGGSGRCVDGACVCHDGYEGADCSLTKCPNDCSLHGVCQDFKCSCSPGWESHDCSVKKCPALCDDHGYCEDGKCVCAEGWSNFPGGNSCQKAVCAGAPDCSGHGVCAPSGKGENKCHCENPWTIESLCAEKSCADDCSSRGSCNNGTCACDDGFWGISCGNVECPKDESWSEGDPRCSGHGTCQQSGVCDCEDGFRGDSCAFRACMNDCSGRGTCTDGICECTDKYFGEDCSKIRCSSDPEKPDCSDSGECIEGVCFCTCLSDLFTQNTQHTHTHTHTNIYIYKM
jgi:tenascin